MRTLDSVTRAIRRTLLALGCALALGACTTWTELPMPSPATLRELGGPVRVIRHDGYSMELRDVAVRGDTLYGYQAETRVAVPLHELKTMEKRYIDPVRTVGAGVIYGVAAFGTLIFLAINLIDESRT
ncbi:MAG TPA: hypothetical protein VFS20_19620 [Longimicrobium sp.]|nr:hypothetical protein [Longimicrobium sp.]